MMYFHSINALAVAEMKHKSSRPHREKGNKYYHGQRVGNLVKRLASEIGYSSGTGVLEVAAWFHDICNGEEDHETAGAIKTAELLKGFCDANELESIYELISAHDSRGKEDLSIEAKILQDADLLDHFGCFEIWSAFQYAQKEQLSMNEIASLMKESYHRDFDSERALLNFDVSKCIYDEKRSYALGFITRLGAESQGNIVDFDLQRQV